MDLLGQVIVAGLGTGAVYALIAYGIFLIWAVSRTLNFAHGDILMVGVFSSLIALSIGSSGLTAIATAILVGAVLGIALNKLVFSPLRMSRGSLTWVLGVVVFAAVIRNIATLIFEGRSYPAPFALGGEGHVSIPGGAVFRLSYLWLIAIALVAGAGLELLMRKTAFGRSVRAVAAHRTTAELMGIDSERVMTIVFALAAATGTLAGLLIAPVTFVSVSLGWLFTLKGFVAAVLGGIGSGKGALLGGLVLGLLEQGLVLAELTGPPSIAPAFAAGYRDAYVFLLLIAVLLVRPGGLVGSASTDRWS